MKKQKYCNKKRDNALEKFSEWASLDDDNSDLTKRCKFNFSYFDYSQPAAQNFTEWSEAQLHNLLSSLKDYCKNSLSYWESQAPTYVVYGDFPKKTDFEHPVHVPHQAIWGRFRLGNKVRLVGFVVPKELHGDCHPVTKERYDKNTFYIVFLDKNHKFWKTKSK